MKVNYIYRSPLLKGFSIENVFNSVSNKVAETYEIEIDYLPRPEYSISAFIENIKYAINLNGDVYHVTGHIHFICVGLPGKKTVLTIHDLRDIERFKNNVLKRIIYKIFWVWYPVRKCAVVTAISEKTKDEVLALCPWAKNKVVVVPDPISDQYRFVEHEFNSACPCLFLLGTKDNKNHLRMIEAIKDIPCVLDIVGKIPEEEMTLLKKYKINYNSYQFLSDEEIIALYTKCDIVMFASTYEGFGMPIIEGQKTGRAILTSNISPMKDVCGEGACLVDPYSIESIRSGVIKLIEDRRYREEIIQKGIANAEAYSAEAIAREYIKIYSNIEKGVL